MEKIGMTLYDHFELPELSKYHMLKDKYVIINNYQYKLKAT